MAQRVHARVSSCNVLNNLKMAITETGLFAPIEIETWKAKRFYQFVRFCTKETVQAVENVGVFNVRNVVFFRLIRLVRIYRYIYRISLLHACFHGCHCLHTLPDLLTLYISATDPTGWWSWIKIGSPLPRVEEIANRTGHLVFASVSLENKYFRRRANTN